jgi:H+/Na+-translocating ferredoxin:NAD+ oxidoreductase subunit B
MHTVIEPYCTGCELCIPACPVDCISLENASGERTGWQAWSQGLADQAKKRYEFHKGRITRDGDRRAEGQEAKAQAKLTNSPTHTHDAQGAEAERKRAAIEAALERARIRAMQSR